MPEAPSRTTDLFGKTDPREMPLYFFRDAIDIDYSTAVRADVAAQDYRFAPRHWYVDATFRCAGCNCEFVWSTEEQKGRFERDRIFVDSQVTHCPSCREATEDFGTRSSSVRSDHAGASLF